MLGAMPAVPGAVPTPADVSRDPMEGPLRRVPWDAPVWDAGVGGERFVPGFVRRHVSFWADVIFPDHPLRSQLVSFLKDGVDLYDLLLDDYRGSSSACPHALKTFPGAVFKSRIPPAFEGFVEVSSLVSRVCVVKWADVRGPGGPPRPRVIMALSIEETKPRMIYDGHPRNQRVRRFPFSMDTVARAANVATQGCYMTSLGDSSAFHHILLRPSSWPLFGFCYEGVDYVWCVLPFGFSLSPWVYYTLSETKAAFLRSKGTPALAYPDDSWLRNFLSSVRASAWEQWLAAREATHVAMLVSFLCGQFLSAKKCDLRPTPLQQYLGMMCDSSTATFRVPQDNLDTLQLLLRTAVDDGRLSFRALQPIAGKCMSMTVAVRPASLWTHAMSRTLADLEKMGVSSIDLTSDSRADLRGEFQQWSSITATSQEGPWQRARHCTAALQTGTSDASSVAWGGVVRTATGAFPAGGVFPEDWLSKHINLKEIYALYYLLQQFCARLPKVLRRAQVLGDVDNQSVVGVLNRGRARNREAHALLAQLFELQIEYDFMLSLRWVPTEANGMADTISRPSRETTVRVISGGV